MKKTHTCSHAAGHAIVRDASGQLYMMAKTDFRFAGSTLVADGTLQAGRQRAGNGLAVQVFDASDGTTYHVYADWSARLAGGRHV